MGSGLIAALLALFAWWFFTGIILLGVRYADRIGQAAPRLLVFGTLPLLIFGAFLVAKSLVPASVAASYSGFFGALLLWGWIETAFLAGVITGPNHRPCPDHHVLRPGERFLRAWGTIAYHDILLLVTLLALWGISADAPNHTAFWTFFVLFCARISAQLNLYAGVPFINNEFIPAQLAHLASHFGKAQMNWIFPLSILGLSWTSACWLERWIAAEEPGYIVHFALLASLTSLAMLEHWLMVLPMPDAKLWRWMLPAPLAESKDQKTEELHGF